QRDGGAAVGGGGVGLALVDRAVAVQVASNRHRLAVGAGGCDGAVRQRAGDVEVRQRLGLAAVGIVHGHVGLHLVERAGAIMVELQLLRQPVGAGRAEGLVGKAAVRVERLDVDRGRAVGIDGLGLLSRVAIGVERQFDVGGGAGGAVGPR